MVEHLTPLFQHTSWNVLFQTSRSSPTFHNNAVHLLPADFSRSRKGKKLLWKLCSFLAESWKTLVHGWKQTGGGSKRHWRFSAVVAISRTEFYFFFSHVDSIFRTIKKWEVVEWTVPALFHTVVTRFFFWVTRSASRLIASTPLHVPTDPSKQASTTSLFLSTMTSLWVDLQLQGRNRSKESSGWTEQTKSSSSASTEWISRQALTKWTGPHGTYRGSIPRCLSKTLFSSRNFLSLTIIIFLFVFNNYYSTIN